MKKTLLIGLIALLLLALPVAAFAAPLYDTTVPSGDVVNNDITVLDGDVEVEEGATVNGDITVFNGDAIIAGTVRGDVVLFNGDMEAADTAVIRGECVVFSGQVEDNTERGLGCTDIANFNLDVPNFMGPTIEMPDGTVEINQTPPFLRVLGNLAGAIGQSIVLSLFAFGLASLAPNQLTRAEETVRQKAVASGAIGSLTLFGVPALLVILSIISALLILACGLGLLGFPIVLALTLAFAAATIFGWIVMGTLVGEKLSTRLNIQTLSLPMIAALGTAVMTFGIGLLGVLPLGFFEGALSFFVAVIGLGAVALTQFGTKPFPRHYRPTSAPTVDTGKETAVLNTLPDDEI